MIRGQQNHGPVIEALVFEPLKEALAGAVAATNLMFVYHNFKDDTGSIDYGDEYDFLITHKLGKHYALLAKYAFYDGDGNAPGALKNDTQKIWVQANVSF